MRPSELPPGRWREIDAILGEALDLPAERRPAFLRDACEGDDALRTQVELLLEAASATDPRFEAPELEIIEEALAPWVDAGVGGRRVGPFRLLREIGRGGMGVVYLAEDTRLGRHVALKVLPPWVGTGREAKRRFQTEARAVSALDHPNIATLHAIDESDEGQLYMVFSYYEGETLDARLARGPLPPAEAIDVAEAIARGLGVAHAKGVIHRDVKPSNILLGGSDTVKLLDFGVAKMAGEDLTAEGIRVGTVAYMSPEQLRAQDVDPRADLWSLGVVLYETLTGRHPFHGSDPPSMLRAILDDEPGPLQSFDLGLADTLQPVLDKLLCKDPRLRYQSTEDLLTDLRAAREGQAPPVAERQPPPATRPNVGRVAVLPFADLTDDAAQEHLVHGVHDAVIAELGKVGALGVVSRTSVARFRDGTVPIPEIAEMLDVDAVIEGSISRAGDRLVVAARLLTASPERQLWSDTFHRDLEGVLDVATEIARSIADELSITLSPFEQQRLEGPRSVDPSAYDAYTMGLLYLERRSPESHEQAQRHLRRAIDLDPGFAPAYAMLAEACGSAAFFGLISPAEGIPTTRSLVHRALSLDPELAPAHAVLGAVRHFGDWDWKEAEASLRRAITLSPSYAYSYFMLAEVLSVQRRYPEALAAAERYRALEPFVPFSVFGPVAVLTSMRDFDGAIARVKPALEFFSDFWQGPWLLARSLLGKGLHSEAVRHCEAAVELSGRTPTALGALGFTYAVNARAEEAVSVLDELDRLSDTVYVGSTNFAMIHGALGDPDRAFAWLDQAYREREMALVHAGDEVFYDPLRSDPRFDALLAQIGLDPATDRVGSGDDPVGSSAGHPPRRPEAS
ncbi:MAG: protein kinase [Longimicrobiales bacterium]|nr:protein kinase [Longimicrobiales bacterium]